MILQDLLKHLEYQCLAGDASVHIETLVYDSRNVCENSVFVCIKGAIYDSHDHIEELVQKKVTAIVVEREVPIIEGITYILVKNTRVALGNMSAAYFGYPATKLKTIGITGTKGKTTTTYMVKSILENAGIKTGLIGTVETLIGEKSIPANNTTPESYLVQQYFSEMVKEGCDCVVMEVSSQGLMLERVSGFTFDYGIFMNLEPDHIGPNEHKDMADYILCKSLLFRQCKVGIVNVDDSHVNEILKDHTCVVETFGCSEQAQLCAKNMQLLQRPGFLGIQYKLEGLISMDVEIDFPGKFSVYNSLAAIAICRHFNVKEEIIKEALSKVKVRGRVEPVNVSDQYTVIIDYAHNAMSLENLLSSMREYKPKRLVCLFGCGGNRDKNRRYEMGEISSKLADLTVVTSDNPRYEKPEDIIADILIGVKKASGEYISIPDRKEAIRSCIQNARQGDLIIIAGKGHESYQEIQGVKYKMDDRELIQEIVNEM